MKKLYVVDIQHTIYVMAEGEDSAEEVATRGIREFGDTPHVSAVECGGGPVDPEWLGSIPFGEDSDRTVADILGRSGK